MSYVSLFKNIPEFFSQPIGIAALASVGIHGAIAFILPLVPVDSSKAKEAQTATKPVGLIQLTPQEQSRLPQTTNPSQVALVPPMPLQPNGLPSFANQPTPLGLGNLPAGYSNQPVLPPLSKSSDKVAVSSLPKGQSLQIIPSQEYQLNRSFNAKSAAGFRRVPNLNDIRIAESAPSSVDVRTSTTEERLPAIPHGLPQVKPAGIPQDLPSTPPALPPETNTNLPTNTGVPVASDSGAAPNNPTNKTQDFANPVGQTPESIGQLAFAPKALPAFAPKQTASSTANIGNTINLPSNSNPIVTSTAQQFTKYKQQYPNLQTRYQPIRDTISYKPGIQGQANGSLVVDSEGKIASLDFSDNSISSNVKTATRDYLREYFQKNPVKTDGKPQYYSFNLSFVPHNNNSSNLPQIPLKPVQINNNHLLVLPTTYVKPSSLPPVNPYAGQASTTTETEQKLLGELRTQPVNTEQTAIKPLPQATSSEKPNQKMIQELRNYRDSKTQH